MIHVVAGAVIAGDGRVLIAERPPGKHLAGHWEFPGGKLEPGETRVQGLARELREELGITIRDPRPLMRVRHTYDFGEVLIDLWVVSRYSGEPQGLDGQRLRWCALEELGDAELLIADRPLIRALWLPERLTVAATHHYVIGDVPPVEDVRLRGAICAGREDSVTGAGPADFIVIRSTIDPSEMEALCATVSVPVFVVGLSLEEAWKLGASGVAEIPLI